jgi:hypothetical protein
MNHDTSEDKIEDVVTVLVRDAVKPLIDLTCDNGAGGAGCNNDARPSGAMKDEPTDGADQRGKNNVIDGDY